MATKKGGWDRAGEGGGACSVIMYFSGSAAAAAACRTCHARQQAALACGCTCYAKTSMARGGRGIIYSPPAGRYVVFLESPNTELNPRTACSGDHPGVHCGGNSDPEKNWYILGDVSNTEKSCSHIIQRKILGYDSNTVFRVSSLHIVGEGRRENS